MVMIMSNLSVLKQVKAEIGRLSNDRFMSQEEAIRLIADESGVNRVAVDGVLRALQTLTVKRFKLDKDMLIPGVIRILPGAGGLTRRYVKIQSISEKLKALLRG